MQSIKEYHDLTSYNRVSLSGHGLDWSNQPDLFKDYKGLEIVDLPATKELPDISLFAAQKNQQLSSEKTEIDMAALASILVLTHSITATAKHGAGKFYYRSVASAGALYPFELYVATTGVQGLDDGLYHHRVADQKLAKLRDGSYQNEAIRLAQTRLPSEPTLTFFLTSIFFRSAWKYRDRAYRYNLLDTGHLLENLTLALKVMNAPFLICHDFLDGAANYLLGLNTEKEVCLAMVCAWPRTTGHVGYAQSLDDITLMVGEASNVSRVELDYPAIFKTHNLSSDQFCKDCETVDMIHRLGPKPKSWTAFEAPTKVTEELGLLETIQNRRSMRNFSEDELASPKVSHLLEALCSDSSDYSRPNTSREHSVAVGFLTSNCQDYDDGFYILDRSQKAYSLVQAGNHIETMTKICLGQEWLARSALHFLFMTNFETLDQNWGPRGYRYAMLTAGSLGQRLYLASASMKIGCCGIGAFFDDEASQLLGLNNMSKLLYLVAVGPVRKWAQR